MLASITFDLGGYPRAGTAFRLASLAQRPGAEPLPVLTGIGGILLTGNVSRETYLQEAHRMRACPRVRCAIR